MMSPATPAGGPGPAAALPRQQVELLLVHLRKLVRAYKKRQQHVELLRTALQAKTDALNAQRIRLNEARLSSEGAQRDLRAAEEAISSLEFSRDNLIKRVDTLREEVRTSAAISVCRVAVGSLGAWGWARAATLAVKITLPHAPPRPPGAGTAAPISAALWLLTCAYPPHLPPALLFLLSSSHSCGNRGRARSARQPSPSTRSSRA